MVTTERYHPNIMAANETKVFAGGSGTGGFICVTAGTLTILSRLGTTVLNAFPVAAGSVYGLPIYLGVNGYSVVLAGGASGTLLTQ
jgi:hypothetical protein